MTLRHSISTIRGHANTKGIPYDFLENSDAPDSLAATNLVPIQTALAPSIKAAARLRPSLTPPAATNRTGWPVNGDLYCLQISAHAGVRMLYTSQSAKRE